MIYLAAYIILGLVSMTGMVLIQREINTSVDPNEKRKPISRGMIIAFVPLWPVFLSVTIHHDWVNFQSHRTCFWCGEVYRVDDLKAMSEHINHCTKSPVARELAAARRVCEWVDQELNKLDGEAEPFTDRRAAQDRMIDWYQARLP